MLTSLDTLNARIFAAQLHTKFTVHRDGAEPVLLELVEVSEQDAGPQMELFSLQFRGPFKPRLEQRTHRLAHEKLGTFEIFLTAIAADAKGTEYESIFHRFRKTQP